MSTAQAVGISDRFFMRQSGKKPYGKIWVMLHVSNISKQFGAIKCSMIFHYQSLMVLSAH